jgi:hypothetical protein
MNLFLLNSLVDLFSLQVVEEGGGGALLVFALYSDSVITIAGGFINLLLLIDFSLDDESIKLIG